MHCLICNQPIEEGRAEIVMRWFDHLSRQIPLSLVIHEACAHEAAHPSFDWSALEQTRAELQGIFDQLRRPER